MPRGPADRTCSAGRPGLPGAAAGRVGRARRALPGLADVVDLSASFRLADPGDWASFYPTPHAGTWTYGLPELPGARARIRSARRVASPGCYATAAIVALAPLLAAGLADPRDIVIVAASGTSGAGRTPSAALLATEVMGAVSAYQAGGVHRHTPEIEQALTAVAGGQATISFTPLLAPMPRGILATCTARLAPGAARHSDLREALAAAYADEPFVPCCRMAAGRPPPRRPGSNAVHLQAAADPHAGRAVVVAALDNLGKGAAGPGHPGRQPDARPAGDGRPDRDSESHHERHRTAGIPRGGVAAGLKPSGARDVAVVINDGPARAAAAVFTANRVKAAPVLWSQQVVRGGRVRAVLLNSGGANACTGPAGFADTHASAERLAAALGDSAGEMAVCSTGLIGERLPMALLLPGVDAAVAEASRAGGLAAADAIRTTDTVAKIAFQRVDGGYTIGGMAKGAGMLAPALATMLCVLSTDADLDPAALDAALRAATGLTFDRLDTDGCMSTNDTVLLMASGAAGVRPDPGAFTSALTEVCADLAHQLQADAEGASKSIAIEVVGARERSGRGGSLAGGPLRPAQVRDRRPGRQLGPGAVRGRDHRRRIRPRSAGRGDQRRLGVPERCPGSDRSGVDLGTEKSRSPSTFGRDSSRHDPDHRPDRCLRARELGVLDMTEHSAGRPGAVRPAVAQAKAATLIEALPWLERFHGQIVVIKFGGHAMADDELRLAFAQDIVFLRYAGLRPVVVHGGGPQINAHLDRLGMETTFRAGLRVTTPEAMDVVRMVLTGQVNRDVVGLINQHGPFAVGMSGEDAHLMTARRVQATTADGETVDIGQVGEVESVDPGAISALIADGRIPVISSVARSDTGEVLNVNADTAAAALAVALGAAKLVVLTDVAGLYAHWPGDEGSGREARDGPAAEVISELSAAASRATATLSGGMIPKMAACLRPSVAESRRRMCSTGGCRTRYCLRFSLIQGSAPWWCPGDVPDDRHRTAPGPVRCRADGDLRHAAGGAGARPGLPGVGCRRPRVHRPDRGHRGQLARARASGHCRGGEPGRSGPSRTPPTCSCTRERSRWPSGCWGCWPRTAGCSSPTRAPRRTRRRSSWPAGSRARPARSWSRPRADSTAGAWVRSR